MTESSSRPSNRWSFGPAIIVASVVVGPGSILTCSQVGQQFGFDALWIVPTICLLLAAMMVLACRVGLMLEGTVCDGLTKHSGRPVAVVIGLIMFVVVAAFQSSNNIAVVAAVTSFFPDSQSYAIPVLIGLNGILIAVMYGLSNLYRPFETLMKVLVGAMLIGFAANVFFAAPKLTRIIAGFRPSFPADTNWLLLAGLVGTTFSIAGAFYQSYLVRAKGWTKADLKVSSADGVVGVGILCLISLMIMTTSATVFSGSDMELKSLADVAEQLRPLFGESAVVLFSVGIFAGAFSSFLGNAMIGGIVLSDGLGKGSSIDERWPKALTAAALLVGMLIACAVERGFDRVHLITVAQALTVVGGPSLALTLIFLASKLRKEHPAAFPGWLMGLAILGCLVTAALAIKTVIGLAG